MRFKAGLWAVVFASSALAFAFGCGDDDDVKPDTDGGVEASTQEDTSVADATKDTSKPVRARATLLATTLADAGNVNGTVDFELGAGGAIAVTINVSGARGGMHGVHIHETGKCDDVDGGAAAAAGPHWNPADAGHGLPDSPIHHPGDLGNVDVPFSGVGTKTLTVSGFSIVKGEANTAVGRAVIFHAGMDDGTGTTGNSGGRAGCGVIEER